MKLVAIAMVEKKGVVMVEVKQGNPKEVDVSALTIMSRAKRGLKVVKRGLPVLGLARPKDDLFASK